MAHYALAAAPLRDGLTLEACAHRSARPSRLLQSWPAGLSEVFGTRSRPGGVRGANATDAPPRRAWTMSVLDRHDGRTLLLRARRSLVVRRLYCAIFSRRSFGADPQGASASTRCHLAPETCSPADIVEHQHPQIRSHKRRQSASFCTSPKTMEFYTLPSPAYPEDIREIALGLWTDLPSAQDLRARLIAASTMPGDEGDRERAALDFAFLEGRAVRPNVPCHFLQSALETLPLGPDSVYR